jgi:hypothetical protein
MSFEGFIGSIWFGAMLFLGGYICGNVVPMGSLISFFRRD